MNRPEEYVAANEYRQVVKFIGRFIDLKQVADMALTSTKEFHPTAIITGTPVVESVETQQVKLNGVIETVFYFVVSGIYIANKRLDYNAELDAYTQFLMDEVTWVNQQRPERDAFDGKIVY